MRGVLRFSGVLVIAGAAQAAVAADEITPWAGVATVYSDNPQYSHANATAATALDAVAGLRVRRTGPITANADVSALYREYVNGPLGSELLPSGNALVTAAIVPERFSFTAEDNLGQISRQVFDALSTVDRQNVNFATAGPDLQVPLGARNRLGFEARYGVSTFQRSNIDSHRYDGQLSFIHLMSEYSQLSVNYNYQRIEYRLSDLYPRIDKDAAYLRHSGESSRTYLVLEGGVESVKVGEAGEHRTSPHASIALQRRVSPRTTLNFEYSHGFSDAADSLRTNIRQGSNPGGDQNVQAIAEPFAIDSGYAMLFRTGARGSAALRVTWDRERYQKNTFLDRTLHGSDLLVDYRLSPLWTLAGKVRWVHEQFTNTDVHSDHQQTSVGITRQLSRSFQAALVVEHTRSTGSIALDDFGENRASLVFNYVPQGSNARIFDPVSQFRSYERPVHAPAASQQNSATP
jgi:hypothetical protein